MKPIAAYSFALALAAGFLAGSPAPGQDSAETELPSSAILDIEAIALPSFAELLAGPRSPTEGESCCSDANRAAYERARTDARFELLRLTYRSDGLQVVAFVYRDKTTT